jgi:sulfite reductase beta subunit-like hemoprotein
LADRATDNPTLELVLKRNSVERLKREKSPLLILDELPSLIAAGYEQVPEEDLVRLKWWGLYHDKPKIGTFMLRVKIPGGILQPEQLRAIGEISNVHGRGEGELTTRQNVQLHFLELAALPDVFDRLGAAGLTSAGACGDTVRNITGCPVAGLGHELFDATPVLEEAAAFFYGNPDYSDLPRKHKISITACADSCAAPEINCVGLVGALRDGEEGFGVLVGGGLSSVPRIGRELGVWVPKGEAVQVLAAILDEWREDLRYRVSRVKARLKFMIDDIGPEGMRERVEARLGRRFDDFTLPVAPRAHNHLGVHERYAGVPVHLGLITGDQMIALADLGHEVRITRQQNLVLATGEDVSTELAVMGLPLDASSLRGDAIACTGEPHCNFSVTETKSRMDGLVQLLERSFAAPALEGLRLHLDGCPHACAQHWVGDLGFQGTTVRDEEGKRRQAYDVYLRGSLDRPAAIARPVFRRVPTEELDDVVVGLVGGWVDARGEGESFRSFVDRSSDDELSGLAGREAHVGRTA